MCPFTWRQALDKRLEIDGVCQADLKSERQTSRREGARTDGPQPATVRAPGHLYKVPAAWNRENQAPLIADNTPPRTNSLFKKTQHSQEYNHSAMTRRIHGKFFPPVSAGDTDPDKEKEKVGERKTDRER